MQYYQENDDKEFYHANLGNDNYFRFNIRTRKWNFVDKFKDRDSWDYSDEIIFKGSKSSPVNEAHLKVNNVPVIDIEWADKQIKNATKQDFDVFMDDLAKYSPDQLRYYRYLNDINVYYAEYDAAIFIYSNGDNEWRYNKAEKNRILDDMHYNRTRSKDQLIKSEIPLMESVSEVELKVNEIPLLSERRVKKEIKKKRGFLIRNLLKKFI